MPNPRVNAAVSPLKTGFGNRADKLLQLASVPELSNSLASSGSPLFQMLAPRPKVKPPDSRWNSFV